jgi:hypothetical protein
MFLLELLRPEFELDLATFIHDDNQKLLSLEASITDTWRLNSRKPLMTAIEDFMRANIGLWLTACGTPNSRPFSIPS